MSISREKLLAAKLELPIEVVDLPELGGQVNVRGLSGKGLSAFYKTVRKPGKVTEIDEENFNARLVTSCLVDDKGNRLLKDDEYNVTSEWPGSVFNRLVTAALKVNGLAGGN
jgi:hypothetical protein